MVEAGSAHEFMSQQVKSIKAPERQAYLNVLAPCLDPPTLDTWFGDTPPT
jgi:hypothetical protein